MPGELLKQIDRNKDIAITGQEIKDFLDGKNKTFLPSEKNLQDLAKEMDINLKEKKPGMYIDERALGSAYEEIAQKIMQNGDLTPSESKLLKLYLYIKKGNADVAAKILKINPNYKKIDKKNSVDISQNIPLLNQTLLESQNMMIDFLSNMQATMKASSDYRLYKNIIKNISEFLQKHPVSGCSSYADYQSKINAMADFFNQTIHSNGLLIGGGKNPAYKYFRENASTSTGSDSVGVEPFIKFGNILKSLGTIQSVKDKEQLKGEYYATTREMLGGGFYGTQQGFMGSFYQSENMANLQDDVLQSEDFKKYPDLKLVTDFLKKMKEGSLKDGQSQLSGEEQFATLIKNLNGKVPVNFILHLQKVFKDANMQEEIDAFVKQIDVGSLSTIAIMQVLGEQVKKNNMHISEQELLQGCEYYKKNGVFQASIMTLFEMNGIDTKKIKSLIQDKTKNYTMKQYNMMVAQRFAAVMLAGSLQYDDGKGRADVLSKNNALFKIYNDVEGIGHEGGMADSRIQRLKGMADQVALTIAITALSGGLGSLAARGLLGGLEAATSGGRIALFAAKMIVEGSVFHASNTLLTGAISNDWATAVEELKSPAARSKSVLYMGVMSGVGRVLNAGTLKLGSPLLKQGVNPKYFEQLSKGLQLPTEIAGMLATDQIVSLTFDQKLQHITMESLVQTITLVVGLKAAHKIVPIIGEQGPLTTDEVEITGQTIKEGVVTDISYQQKIINSLDAKTEYLSKLIKIKSNIKTYVAKNILNSIDADVSKNPNKDYSKSLQEVKKTIEQLRQEGKSSPSLEKKYMEIEIKIKKTEEKKISEEKNKDLLESEIFDEKKTKELLAEGEEISQELEHIEEKANEIKDEHQRNVFLKNSLQKAQSFLRDVYEGYVKSKLTHFKHNMHEDRKLAKKDGMLLKVAATVGMLSHITYLGFEIKHFYHTLHQLSEGTYDHLDSEQVSSVGEAIYQSMDNFKEAIIHLDLRIKDHIDIEKFTTEIISLVEYTNNIGEYTTYLYGLSIKYPHIDIVSIEGMLPQVGPVGNELHLQIINTIAKSFEKEYYSTADRGRVDAMIEKASQLKKNISMKYKKLSDIK
ncbi:MAG: hypothetical protein NTY80_01385 [candidate division SR1 bacterium]|nr:hypothetical protein [candidate division SR1 bacterium]